ncbi:MAG: alpha/beta hydrolase [Planctomycetota bacterium]
MKTGPQPPLILFSGLAADASVFRPQKVAHPDLLVPKWPKPKPNETLDEYCDRIEVDLSSYHGGVVGGASFGGIIALHLANRLNAKAVILIGSVRSPEQLSRLARCARPLKPLIAWIPIRIAQWICRPFTMKLLQRWFPHTSAIAQQFCNADRVVFRWSLERILDWNLTPKLDCPVFQIHGDRDWVLPIRNTRPDQIVKGGGHVISLTHARDVNQFIDRVRRDFSQTPAAPS